MKSEYTVCISSKCHYGWYAALQSNYNWFPSISPTQLYYDHSYSIMAVFRIKFLFRDITPILEHFTYHILNSTRCHQCTWLQRLVAKIYVSSLQVFGTYGESSLNKYTWLLYIYSGYCCKSCFGIDQLETFRLVSKRICPCRIFSISTNCYHQMQVITCCGSTW